MPGTGLNIRDTKMTHVILDGNRVHNEMRKKVSVKQHHQSWHEQCFESIEEKQDFYVEDPERFCREGDA